MLLVFVYGIPDGYPSGKLVAFWKKLRKAVKDNQNLNLVHDQVSIFFPRDRLQEGLGEEIIILVEGLFDYVYRIEQARNQYAATLGKIAKEFFPDALIECFIKPFKNIEQGFWRSD